MLAGWAEKIEPAQTGVFSKPAFFPRLVKPLWLWYPIKKIRQKKWSAVGEALM